MTTSRRLAPLVLLVAVSQVLCSLQLALGTQECDHSIVQSMPDGMDLKDPPGAKIIPTHECLIEIVENSKKTLRIVSFYWWLTAPKEFQGHPSVEPGRKLMDSIAAAAGRGVDVAVVLDKSGRKDMSNPEDIESLRKIGKLSFLNMTRLLKSGVVHSKFMIADNQTFYVGSSNFDWRSYTQIKEIGITYKNCPSLAEDLDKIFRTYALMATSKVVPERLSDDLKTSINLKEPLELDDQRVFLAGSPPPFNGLNDSIGRTNDIEGLLHILDRAHHRVDISVMNYSPRMEFVWPRKYWPRIDEALRRAAVERRVKVRLLFSNWTSTKALEMVWYRSLNEIQSEELRGGGIHVKLFHVPAFDDFQKSIPFARVKHDKYMVTEGGLYIGTSNWTPDYFISTCGVGVVIEPAAAAASAEGKKTGLNKEEAATGLIKVMQDVFERDFNSKYAHELD